MIFLIADCQLLISRTSDVKTMDNRQWPIGNRQLAVGNVRGWDGKH